MAECVTENDDSLHKNNGCSYLSVTAALTQRPMWSCLHILLLQCLSFHLSFFSIAFHVYYIIFILYMCNSDKRNCRNYPDGSFAGQ